MSDEIRIPLRELRFTFARSSGPGGQNVNKVATKAILHWDVVGSRSLPDPVRARLLARYPRRITRGGELVITSQRFRDRGRNVADCLEKLRALLLSVARPQTPRRPTRPTAASRSRRLADKRRRSTVKRKRSPPRDED